MEVDCALNLRRNCCSPRMNNIVWTDNNIAVERLSVLGQYILKVFGRLLEF